MEKGLERRNQKGMERERGNPSGSFFRGFGMMPSLFGGRDPFDDPFFTRPTATVYDTLRPGDGEKGLVIEELESDDEAACDHRPSSGPNQEPSVQHPDDDDDSDDANDKRSESVEIDRSKPEAGKFSYSTSKVTYGGVDGAYYASTRTRRTGVDGTVVEENREADKVTGQASHRISRGIHDKGHSVTQKLNTGGKVVDVVQTLHNLEEDELAGFEEAWKGSLAPSFGSNDHFDFRDAAYKDRTINEGWLLPSIEQAQRATGNRSDFGARSNQSAARAKKVVRINIE